MKHYHGLKSPQNQWKWFSKKKKSNSGKTQKATPIDLSPQGHIFNIHWPKVPGALKAIVDEADLRFTAYPYNRAMGNLDKKSVNNNKAIDLDLKQDGALRYLKFDQLKSGDVLLKNSQNLSSNLWRLLCSAKLNGAWVPLYAVPLLGKRGAIPAMLGGASFNHGLLSLPGKVVARHWRLEITSGSVIEDLSPQPIQLKTATGTLWQAPEDPKVIGPDDQEIWSQNGPWFGTNGAVSLRLPLEQALQKVLDDNSPNLAIDYRLTGAEHGKVNLLSNRVKGSLLREHSGVWDHQLQGEPLALDFDPILASERPYSAKADLTLNYAGIRLLNLAKPNSANLGKINGRIISSVTTTLPLPPKIFGEKGRALPPARVGILGRAVADGELVAKFFDRTSQRVIGEPAVLEIRANPKFQIHWFHFKDQPFLADTPQLEITATRGRFYWVEGQPATLKFAVYDPDPGQRPLLLKGRVLTHLAQTRSHQPGVTLPTAPFQGANPYLTSDLFMQVELTDLQLRYQR